MSKKQWADWYKASDAAWEKAAQALEDKGYKRTDDPFYAAVFVKDGMPDLYLGCGFGEIDWTPRELGALP